MRRTAVCSVLLVAVSVVICRAEESASTATATASTTTTSTTSATSSLQSRFRVQPASAGQATSRARMTPASSSLHGAGTRITPASTQQDAAKRYRVQRVGDANGVAATTANGATTGASTSGVPRYQIQPLSQTTGTAPAASAPAPGVPATSTSQSPGTRAAPFHTGRPIGGADASTSTTH